jgi:hypothetical protein
MNKSNFLSYNNKDNNKCHMWNVQDLLCYLVFMDLFILSEKEKGLYFYIIIRI